jgi:hypothetical protein
MIQGGGRKPSNVTHAKRTHPHPARQSFVPTLVETTRSWAVLQLPSHRLGVSPLDAAALCNVVRAGWRKNLRSVASSAQGHPLALKRLQPRGVSELGIVLSEYGTLPFIINNLVALFFTKNVSR